jgi:hypothetical protein
MMMKIFHPSTTSRLGVFFRIVKNLSYYDDERVGKKSFGRSCRHVCMKIYNYNLLDAYCARFEGSLEKNKIVFIVFVTMGIQA